MSSLITFLYNSSNALPICLYILLKMSLIASFLYDGISSAPFTFLPPRADLFPIPAGVGPYFSRSVSIVYGTDISPLP